MMDSKFQGFVRTVLSLGLLVLLATGCQDKPSEHSRVEGAGNLIQEVSDSDHFRSIVQKADGRLLVFDFYADWCQPCKILSPILDKLAVKFKGRAAFYKVDIDRNRELATAAGVGGIPYVMFFKDGTTVDSLTGLHSEDAYFRIIDRHSPVEAAEKAPDTPDGEIVAGVRVVRRSPAAALDNIYVYRGDTVKLVFEESPFPFGVHIPEFGISEETEGPALDLTFKAKNIGVFPIFCNGNCPTGDQSQFGQIVVMQFQASGAARYKELTAEQAKALIESSNPLILDVRTPGEFYSGSIEGAKLIPVQQLEARLQEIAAYRDRDVLLYCRSGNRSTVAAEILMGDGFKKLYNLRYGIRQWVENGYPTVQQ